jgi:predicted permease
MNILSELQYTVKVLLKHYTFTLLCTSVLAIGIAIVLPLYALMVNLAMQTPDLPEAKQQIAIRRELVERRQGNALGSFDAFHYRYFKEHSNSFAALYAWQYRNFSISDGEDTQLFSTAALEPALLSLPQKQPLQGRLFTADDIAIGASPVAIISEDVWQSYYAGRQDIIGHSTRINGEARTIVGVMPAGFRFPLSQDVWVPLALPATVNAAEGAEDLLVVGTLKQGVSMGKASAEIALLQTQILQQWPEQYRHIKTSSVVSYVKILDAVNGGPGSILPIAIFGSLILLVAFNISNLFMARSEERLTELAIRSAMGATTSRIGMSLLLETFAVCLLGLLAGLLLAKLAIDGINTLLSSLWSDGSFQLTRLFWWDMSLNAQMLSTCALVVLAIWLVCGGLPAWRISRRNLSDLLASGGKGNSGGGVTRISKVLVNLQLVMGCVLLTLGVVGTYSFTSGVLTQTPNADNYYLGSVYFSGSKLATPVQRLQYLQNLQQALQTEPGVAAVALTAAPPGGGGTQAFYNLEDQDLKVNDSYPSAYVLTVSANYLDVVNSTLIEGRSFNAGDVDGSQPVIIIDQRLATQRWPDTTALGKRIQLNPQQDSPWFTVIGVTTSVVQEDSLSGSEKGQSVIYKPITQSIADTMTAFVQMQEQAVSAASFFHNVARKVDRDISISDTKTLKELEQGNDDGIKFNRNLFLSFIVIALYITGIATYGLAARQAARRRVETGIRMALGASRSTTMGVFIKSGFKTVLVGFVVGGILGVLVGYGMLMGSGANANGVYGRLIPTVLVIGLVLSGLVILANYIAARRLINMEPAEALRYE